jgi:Flp pilus assembly pilin Flp
MYKLLAVTRSRLYSTLVRRLVKREEGATIVEYALLLGFIAVVCIAAFMFLGSSLNNLFVYISNLFSNAGS